jgi:acyl-CoA reductase-like NAD-dependent aldehyde dehydrogenase
MPASAQPLTAPRFSRERSPLIGEEAGAGTAVGTIVRPFDGQIVAEVADASSLQALEAVTCAAGAVERPLAAHDRATVLERTAALIDDHADELAQLIVDEVSTPITLARVEVNRASTTFRLTASVARTLSGSVVPVDAVAAGAGKVAFTRMLPAGVVVPGGTTLDGGVLAPAVLTGVPHESSLVQQEAFGPVVAVQRARNLDEAFTSCNATPHGLQAAIFAESLEPAFQAFDRLQFGRVVVNEAPTFRADNQPYGGVKDSGNTQEGPAYAARGLSRSNAS